MGLPVRYGAALLAALIALQGCAGAVVVGAAATAAAVSDRRSLGNQIDDQSIELRAIHHITSDKPLYDSSKISVISMNGRVLLIGQTPTAANRARLEELVRQDPTIRQLYNEVRLGQPVSLATRSHDSWLTTKIKTLMTSKGQLDPTKVKVVSENGEVFLIGLVTSKEAETAVDIARNVSGVRRVVKVFEYI